MKESMSLSSLGSAIRSSARSFAVSDHCKMMTVRLGKGVMGQGDMPLQWRSDNEYDLLAGGRVKLLKLL